MPTSKFVHNIGIAKESTWGTAVAPVVGLLVEAGSDCQVVHDPIMHEGRWGNRASLVKTSPGIRSASGEIRARFESENWGEILKAAFGSETLTQEGVTPAWKHLFKPQQTAQLPSLTVRVDRGLSAKDYVGMLVDKLMFSGDDRGTVMSSVTLIGKDEATAGGGSIPALSTLDPYVYSDVDLEIGGAPNVDVKTWEVTMTNDVKLKYGVQTGTLRTPANHYNGEVKVEGKFDIYFESESLRADWLAATKRSFILTATGPAIGASTHRLIVKVPAAIFTVFPWGDVEGALGASVAFRAVYDVTEVAPYSVEVRNTRTTAY